MRVLLVRGKKKEKESLNFTLVLKRRKRNALYMMESSKIMR